MANKSKFGLRADGTPKGIGFFGELPLGGKLKGSNSIATEFSIGVDFSGKETQIPSLVPTLSQEELDLMLNDIIPNKGEIPETILNKAFDHAKIRIDSGKSPFFVEGENDNFTVDSQLFPAQPFADPSDVPQLRPEQMLQLFMLLTQGGGL